MEQLSGSQLGKAYDKAVYGHLACLTYMQSPSCEMPGWINHKLESRLLREVSTTSYMQIYHSNSRERKGTKEPLDEGEREE